MANPAFTERKSYAIDLEGVSSPFQRLLRRHQPLCIVYILNIHRLIVDAQLFLSASDNTPMYQQVIDQITAKVMAGDWPAGAALPSIRELASASQVSVITVKRAYQELERAGVIVTRHGKGSFVAESSDVPQALLRNELESHLRALLACAAKLGLSRNDISQLLDEPSTVLPINTTEEKSHD